MTDTKNKYYVKNVIGAGGCNMNDAKLSEINIDNIRSKSPDQEMWDKVLENCDCPPLNATIVDNDCVEPTPIIVKVSSGILPMMQIIPDELWKIVSLGLNEDDEIDGINIEKNGIGTIKTRKGFVFKTVDGGENWTKVNDIQGSLDIPNDFKWSEADEKQ